MRAIGRLRADRCSGDFDDRCGGDFNSQLSHGSHRRREKERVGVREEEAGSVSPQ